MREQRRKAGFTQEGLAELVDVHPRMIQKIEGGQTNILATTAMRLRAALDCDWSDLMPKVEIRKTVAPKTSR